MKEVVRDVGPALTGPQGGENAGCLPGTVCSISKRCCLWKCRNVWRKRKKKKYKHEAHSHYPRRHRAEVLPQRPLPGSHAGSRGHFHVLSLKQCRRSLRGTWFFPHGSALGRDSRQRGS